MFGRTFFRRGRCVAEGVLLEAQNTPRKDGSDLCHALLRRQFGRWKLHVVRLHVSDLTVIYAIRFRVVREVEWVIEEEADDDEDWI